jgi:hypothetical protein
VDRLVSSANSTRIFARNEMTTKPLKASLYDGVAKPGGNSSAQKSREGQATTTGKKGVTIRLSPVNNSDAAVVANYVSLSPAYGMTFVDFGFLEPSMMAVVQQLVRDGKEPPETLNGKLATRVVLGYDVIASLYDQLGQLLATFQQPNDKT